MAPFASSVLSLTVVDVDGPGAARPDGDGARPGLSARREVAALRDGDADGNGGCRRRTCREGERCRSPFGDAGTAGDPDHRHIVVIDSNRGCVLRPVRGVAGAGLQGGGDAAVRLVGAIIVGGDGEGRGAACSDGDGARPGLSARREVAALRDGDVDGDGRGRCWGRCEREHGVPAVGDAGARGDANDRCALWRRVVVTHCHRGGGGAPDGVAGGACDGGSHAAVGLVGAVVLRRDRQGGGGLATGDGDRLLAFVR